VTFEGEEDSEAVKNDANIYANRMPDVYSVVNNLMATGGK
jgi:uncharacterized membrane protein